MELGARMVFHNTIKVIKSFYCSSALLLSPIVLLLTSEIGGYLKKNMSKTSKTHFFL